MEKKKEPSLSESDSSKNMLRTPFDLVDDYQENQKGVIDTNPPKLIPRITGVRCSLFRREDLVKAMRVISSPFRPAESSENDAAQQQQRIEILAKKIAGTFDCSREQAERIVRGALVQKGINEALDNMFDNLSEFQEIGEIKHGRLTLIPSNEKGVIKLALPNDQLPTDILGQKPDLAWDGEPAFRREDLFKDIPDVDLEEAYPGTRKTNPELYLSSPYPTQEEMITSQNIGMGKLVHVTDKWFFYRVHQFHDVHHKRRKARFDKITFMLLRHSWTEYKESLYKKKYHIFDKTPRAKAERLAIKKIQSARSEGIRLS